MNSIALLRKLLDAPASDIQKNSFENYHVKGVDYLCLHRTPNLTVKIYYFPDSLEHNDMGMLVYPHTHRYAFEHVTLAGAIWDYRYGLDRGNSFWLQSYEAENRRSRPLAKCGLQQLGHKRYGYGEGFYMEPHEIHSIQVTQASIAMQIQYYDETASSIMVSSQKVVNCTDYGMYAPMSVDKIQTIIEKLKEIAR